MARPNAAEVRQLSDADINEQIDGLRRELFNSASSRPPAVANTVSRRSASSWPNC